MKYYDIDGDGNISYEEFVRGLRYVLLIYFAERNFQREDSK